LIYEDHLNKNKFFHFLYKKKYYVNFVLSISWLCQGLGVAQTQLLERKSVTSGVKDPGIVDWAFHTGVDPKGLSR